MSGEWSVGGPVLRDAMRREMDILSRQLECLRLAGEGLSRPQIAARLVVSEHVVHGRMEGIRRRLGAVNTGHAIVLAWRAGLLRDSVAALLHGGQRDA